MKPSEWITYDCDFMTNLIIPTKYNEEIVDLFIKIGVQMT